MRKTVLILGILGISFVAKAQSTNEQEQRVKDCTTKEINKEKVTTGPERVRIERDCKIDVAMNRDKDIPDKPKESEKPDREVKTTKEYNKPEYESNK